jgi:hypothetical protein
MSGDDASHATSAAHTLRELMPIVTLSPLMPPQQTRRRWGSGYASPREPCRKPRSRPDRRRAKLDDSWPRLVAGSRGHLPIRGRILCDPQSRAAMKAKGLEPVWNEAVSDNADTPRTWFPSRPDAHRVRDYVIRLNFVRGRRSNRRARGMQLAGVSCRWHFTAGHSIRTSRQAPVSRPARIATSSSANRNAPRRASCAAAAATL